MASKRSFPICESVVVAAVSVVVGGVGGGGDDGRRRLRRYKNNWTPTSKLMEKVSLSKLFNFYWTNILFTKFWAPFVAASDLLSRH